MNSPTPSFSIGPATSTARSPYPPPAPSTPLPFGPETSVTPLTRIPASPPPTTADTGVQAGQLVALALVLALLGAVFFGLGRRRSH